MKQFAKSLVSVVIALSILATMCIVGVAVSADDYVEVDLISATAEKKASDMTQVHPTGPKAVGEVVNTSTLGAPAGVPATAYKVTIKAGSANKDGIHIPVTGGSVDASAIKALGKNDAYIDAWIYVSGGANMGNPIFRFYGSAGNHNAGSDANPKVEGWFIQSNAKDGNGFHKLSAEQDGTWVHVQSKMNWNNGTDGFFSSTDGIITGFTIHDHVANPAADWTIAVASMKLCSNPANAPKPVTIDESEVALFNEGENAADGMTPTIANNSTISVVKASDLGTGYKGNVADAYKITFASGAARKSGAYMSLKNPVRMKSAHSVADSAGKNGYTASGETEKAYTVEAWIYVEKANTEPLIQFYTDSLETKVVGVNTVEKWAYRYNLTKLEGGLKAGWNHIKVTLDVLQRGVDENDSQTTPAYNTWVEKQFVTGFSIHDNKATDGFFAVADVKLYKTSAMKEPEKDANKVGTTLVSANKDKDVANVTSTNGADIGITVVESSTLKGGTAGVPAKKAYKVPLKTKQVGIVVPVENPDWAEASDKDLNGYAVNAWVWISDASKINNLVIRYYEEGMRNGVGGWTYQWNSSGFKTNTPLQAGWNNVNFIFPATGDYNHKTNNNSDGHKIVEFTIHDHGNTPDYELAIACARLVKVTDDVSGGWLAGSATGDATNVAMVVVAILLAAMAASVTVYFGKKAR